MNRKPKFPKESYKHVTWDEVMEAGKTMQRQRKTVVEAQDRLAHWEMVFQNRLNAYMKRVTATKEQWPK